MKELVEQLAHVAVALPNEFIIALDLRAFAFELARTIRIKLRLLIVSEFANDLFAIRLLLLALQSELAQTRPV